MGTHPGIGEGVEEGSVDSIGLVRGKPECYAVGPGDEEIEQRGEIDVAVAILREVHASQDDLGAARLFEGSGPREGFGGREADGRSASDPHAAIGAGVVAAVLDLERRPRMEGEGLGVVSKGA